MNEPILPQIQPITNKQIKDLTGQRFGRLVVLGYVGSVKRRTHWLCRCDCGKESVAAGGNLRSGITQSCGCLHSELLIRSNTTHGMAHRTPEYRSWTAMLTRCTNPNSPNYPNYGGRGISVCDRWRSFENFYADMGPRPDGCSVDRIDVNGNYEPDNCRWATKATQANNTRANIPLTHNGRTMNLAEWARESGISVGALRRRIFDLGWSTERSLTTPLRKMAHRQ